MKKILIVGLVAIVVAIVALGVWSPKQQTRPTASPAP